MPETKRAMSLLCPIKPNPIRRRETSKGCNTCRARKIKCDQRSPRCSQCEKADRQCTGPIIGNIFLDSGSKITRRHSSARHKRAKRLMEAREGQNFKDKTLSNREATPSKAVSFIPASGTDNFRLPSWYQPSKSFAFEQFFLSHFIKAYAARETSKSNNNYWMSQLPEIVSSNSNITLRLAINAVSMAFYGKLTNDKSIEMEGSKWYGRSLEVQQKRLQRDSYIASLIPSPVDVCVPLIMSFYETVIATIRDGWAKHLCGAARMIELRGPEQCREGLALQMFRSVRFGMFFVAIAKEQPSFFADKKWLTIPFEKTRKLSFDFIVDILTVVPVYLEKINALKPDGTKSSKMVEIHRKLTELGEKLDGTWKNMVAAAISQFGTPEELEIIRLNIQSRLSSEEPIIPERIVKHPLMIDAKSLYNSGKLLILSTLQSISPPENRSDYNEQITGYCISIFSALNSLDLLRSNSGNNPSAPFRMMFALSLVTQRGILRSHRMYAKIKLNQWADATGLSRPEGPNTDFESSAFPSSFPHLYSVPSV